MMTKAKKPARSGTRRTGGEHRSDAPWAGRFERGVDPLVHRYTRSLHLDRRLARQDVKGSRAHVRMLARQGIVSGADRDRILTGLDQIEAEIRAGTFPFREELEDIHMNIERRLQELIGEAGSRLHTGRSRNDQVALDLRLYVLEAGEEWVRQIRVAQAALVDRADALRDRLFPAWTHLQAAQPLSWGHYLLALAEMLRRDEERLDSFRKRHCVSPLGAGALAGSTLDLDPEQTARDLGFDRSFDNSYDVVGDRDFLLELLQIGSQIMLHLSRLSEDFIYFSSTPVGWVELPDALCTGSSMMPQKKNPDLLELMRGKTATVLGHVMAVSALLKGLPTSYHRDLQQDKEHLFAGVDIVTESLEIIPAVVSGFQLIPDRIEAALQRGQLMATDLAEHLVMRGVPFREAHHQVGRLVAHCVERGIELDELSLEMIRAHAPACAADLGFLRPGDALKRRNHRGATGLAPVQSQIRRWRSRLRKKRGGKTAG